MCIAMKGKYKRVLSPLTVGSLTESFKKLFLLGLLIASLVSCQSNGPIKKPRVERTQYIMGTQAKLISESQDLNYGSKVFARLKLAESIFSNYDGNSVLNKWYLSPEMNLPEEFVFLVNESVRLCELTQGRFNIKVGHLVKDIYNFKSSKKLPPHQLVEDEVRRIQSCRIQLKSLKKPPKLDFGALGKGYGLDLARTVISKGEQTIVSLSGDIFCQEECRFSLDKKGLAQKVNSEFKTCKPESTISTSGNYRQYIGTPENNHIIDAKTGRPQRQTKSITIVGTGPSYLIDAWTTILSQMSLKERENISLTNLAWMHTSPQGKVTRSSNFSEFFCRP